MCNASEIAERAAAALSAAETALIQARVLFALIHSDEAFGTDRVFFLAQAGESLMDTAAGKTADAWTALEEEVQRG